MLTLRSPGGGGRGGAGTVCCGPALFERPVLCAPLIATSEAIEKIMCQVAQEEEEEEHEEEVLRGIFGPVGI